MKRLLITMICLVVTMSLFSGCLQQPSEKDSKETQPSKESSDSKKAEAPAEDTSKKPITIRVALGGPKTLAGYQALDEICVKELGEKTNGRIKFELYPGSQLGDDVKAITAARSGTLEMVQCASAAAAGLVKEISLFDTPFLFETAETAHYVLDGKIGDQMKNLIAEKGVYLLGWSELGFRHLTNSVRDVRTPDDVNGLKIRTMENPVHLATWRALGANPTPMPISEVFTAIQQHAIDGQENPCAAFYGWKIHEVNKHISLTGHVYSPQLFLFSQKIFDTYPKEDQELIKEYVKKAGERAREIAGEQEADYVQKLRDAGCNVIELTSEEKAAFQEATASVWDSVAETVGDDLMNSLKKELKKAPK